MEEVELSVIEFVSLVNQTLEFAYPTVTITGELANLRISKNRWLYFDLKDEEAIVHFFGTIYQLPGPLQDGMLLKVKATPRLHSRYGFSLTVQTIRPTGVGSIKKAAGLLEAKLTSEGLFDVNKKRSLPYPPDRIGLITSSESAAYSDFVKILNNRWGGMQVVLCDVQVQGEHAAEQIVSAIEELNIQPVLPEVLVLIRGGGSVEDLMVFSSEQVTRAIAASRIPTLVAVGHERDTSLSELAADVRASTPSNAAELLVPDKSQIFARLSTQLSVLQQEIIRGVGDVRACLDSQILNLIDELKRWLGQEQEWLQSQKDLLEALSPRAVLARGYALITKAGKIADRDKVYAIDEEIGVLLHSVKLYAKITAVHITDNSFDSLNER